MRAASKMFTCVKRFYKALAVIVVSAIICFAFIYATKAYRHTDLGKTFGSKAAASEKRLDALQDHFMLCAKICNADTRFMQSIVFPEVMRYSSLKDGIETESLRTLYVQFGAAYANFSIGLFQMKPAFAEQVETKSKQLLPEHIYKELQLAYPSTDEQSIRQQRVERLQDNDWQLVYLTAFISLCNELYKAKNFSSPTEKLQWYATIYNAGFDRTDAQIKRKIEQDNFYLSQQMPGKKFKYAAIAAWFYNKRIT